MEIINELDFEVIRIFEVVFILASALIFRQSSSLLPVIHRDVLRAVSGIETIKKLYIPLDKTWHLMEVNIQWKTTFHGRQHLLEDDFQ